MTSAYAVIGIMGPNARDLLTRLSPNDLSNEAFPYMTHREVEIGDTVARAARISYIGELGWELYVPSEAALPLYDRLYEAGAVLGLENAGSFAMAGLRIEKGYCAWGHDIGPDDTPLQAGMGFATKLSANSPFTGRTALEQQREAGLNRRRILLSVDDPEVIDGSRADPNRRRHPRVHHVGRLRVQCRALGRHWLYLARRRQRRERRDARRVRDRGSPDPAQGDGVAETDLRPDGERLRM